MAFVAAICTQCGASISVDDSKDAGICKYCGTAFVTEKIIKNYNSYVTNNYSGTNIFVGESQSKEKDIKAANELLELCDYERARQLFENIVLKYPSDYRGWWGLAKIRCQKLYFDTYNTVIEMLPYISSSQINHIVDAVDLVSKSVEYQRVLKCVQADSDFEKEYTDYQTRLKTAIVKAMTIDKFDFYRLDRYGVEYTLGNQDWSYGIYFYFVDNRLYMLTGCRNGSVFYNHNIAHDISDNILGQGYCAFYTLDLYEISKIESNGKIYSNRRLHFSEKDGDQYFEEEIHIGHFTLIGNRFFIDLNFNRNITNWDYCNGSYGYVDYNFERLSEQVKEGKLTTFGFELFRARRMPDVGRAISAIERRALYYVQQAEEAVKREQRKEKRKDFWRNIFN